MDQPKIPTLKETQKPQVKVRGMSAGLTLFDRLKSFRKKDLAFILAGLGTLFMAPLAEHFMMAPEGADATLQPGMGNGGKGAGRGIFDGSGSGPYEGGVTGLAPGSAVGGGSDIITPLNVRDPSALVMGPGATQQPPTNSVAPATPPPTAPSTRSDSDLKDALAASARGVGAAAGAAKRAALPVPKVAIGGTGLRGLGVSAGGSSAQAGLGPISSNGLTTNKASSGGGLSHVTATPGYKGVASRGPGSGAGKGIEALKNAADGAGNRMNQGGAASALNDAANTGIPNTGAGFGGNGQGGAAGNDKADSGNNDKSAKNVGESLAFMKAKMQMEAEMARKAKRDEANDMGLQMAQWRNKMIENGLIGPLGDAIGGKIKRMFGPGSSGQYVCNGVGNGPPQAIDGGDVSIGSCDGKSTYVLMGDRMYTCKGSGLGKDGGAAIQGDQIGAGCYAQGDVKPGSSTNTGANTGNQSTRTAPQSARTPGNGGVPQPQAANLDALGVTCDALVGTFAGSDAAPIKNFQQQVLSQASLMVAQRDILYKKKTNDCASKAAAANANVNGGTDGGSQYDAAMAKRKAADKADDVKDAALKVVDSLTGADKDIAKLTTLASVPDGDKPDPATIDAKVKEVQDDLTNKVQPQLTDMKSMLDDAGTIKPKTDGLEKSWSDAKAELSKNNQFKAADLAVIDQKVAALLPVFRQDQAALVTMKGNMDNAYKQLNETAQGAVGRLNTEMKSSLPGVSKVNASLKTDLLDSLPKDVAGETKPKPEVPAYATPAAENKGDLKTDLKTATDAIKTAKDAVDDYTKNSTPDKLKTTQTAVKAAVDAVTAVRKDQVANLGGIDSLVTGTRDTLNGGPLAK